MSVDIDAGDLVTQRAETETSKISLGGIYETLEKSENVIKKIIS